MSTEQSSTLHPIAFQEEIRAPASSPVVRVRVVIQLMVEVQQLLTLH